MSGLKKNRHVKTKNNLLHDETQTTTSVYYKTKRYEHVLQEKGKSCSTRGDIIYEKSKKAYSL